MRVFSVARVVVMLAGVVAASGCAASGAPSSAESTSAESTAAASTARSVHCADTSEVSLAEDATGWAVSFRVRAYEGQALGTGLDPSIDPAFFAASTGDHVTFAAHIPKAAGANPACTFSETVSSVFGCGTTSLENASLSDGVTEKKLADRDLTLQTEKLAIDSLYGHNEELVFHIGLPDRPGLANGYNHEVQFATYDCTAQ